MRINLNEQPHERVGEPVVQCRVGSPRRIVVEVANVNLLVELLEDPANKLVELSRDLLVEQLLGEVRQERQHLGVDPQPERDVYPDSILERGPSLVSAQEMAQRVAHWVGEREALRD